MTRTMMKMAAVSTITWLLFFCSVIVFTDAQDVCQYAEKGGNFTVPLLDRLDERLKWKHNDIVILDRKGKAFFQGSMDQLSENGSLKLTNLKEANEGEYQPEIFDKNGKAKALKSIRLCILDPVPKPTVKHECLQKNVKFTCSVKKAKDLKIEWLQNEKVLSAKEAQTSTLTRKAEEVQKDSFSCRVSNSIRFQTSVAVTQNCVKPKPLLPDTLFGINIWIIIGGGGGVVLVLITIIIVCCIRTRRKRSMQVKDEEELRLGWTNPEQQPHHHQHNHPPGQHHHHHQQPPAGHTGPRQHRSKQNREQQQRPKAPDLPNGQPQPSPRRPAQAPRPAHNDDDEQPPPLPQPRKKAPKTPRE